MNHNSIWIDLKHTLRLLKRFPGFSIMSVAALALGIALVTTMYIILYGVVLKGVSYRPGEELKVLDWEIPNENMHRFIRIQDYEIIRDEQDVFNHLGFFTYAGGNLRKKDDNVIPLSFVRSSANLTEVLGVEPVLGRGFTEGEDKPGAEPVVLIGHDYWERHLEGDESLIGQPLWINNEAYTLIGIMPKGFHFPVLHDAWVPYTEDSKAQKKGDDPQVWVYGYLKDEVSEGMALAQLATIAQNIANEYPETNALYTRMRLRTFTDQYVEGAKAIMWSMMVSVILVLFIACANVANLLLAKSVSRSKELAIRSAVGASRGRLVFQILTESLVIAVLGGLLGLLLAGYSTELVVHQLHALEIPYWMTFEFSPHVFLVVSVVVLMASIISGLYPAFQASRPDIRSVLNDESRSSSGGKSQRFTKILIVLQIAMSYGAIIGAFFMIQTTLQLGEIKVPFEPKQVLQGYISISEQTIAELEDVNGFYELLDERLEALPGVEASGSTSAFAMVYPWRSRMIIEGKEYADPSEYDNVMNETVSPDYFEALGIPIIQGRGFLKTDTLLDPDDPDREEIIVINQSMAEQFWPGESPIGKRIRDSWRSDMPWNRIVGVIPDIDTDAYGDLPYGYPHIYRPSSQTAERNRTVFLKTTADPAALIPVVSKIVQEVNPAIVFGNPKTVQAQMEENQRGLNTMTQIFAVTGVVALLLAAIGIYGVISFSTQQRTREFGIRIALGASGSSILSRVLSQGMLQILIGLGLGLLLGMGITQALQSAFGFSSMWNPMLYLIPFIIIMVAGLMAVLLPALKASRITPMEALRDL